MAKQQRKNAIFIVACLLAAITMSSIGVIYSSYKSRQLFSQLQEAHKRSIQMEEEWGRLLLEQSTWASQDRIDGVAKNKLNMKIPALSDIKVIEQ